MTARAARRVREMLQAEHRDETLGLRVRAVDPVGDGGAFRLSLSSGPDPDDEVLPRNGFQVFVDALSAPVVDGVRIDLVEAPVAGGGPPRQGFVVERGRAYGSGAPLPPGAPFATEAPPGDAAPEVVGKVEKALDMVRPAIVADGGSADLVSVAGGTAYVRLGGACSGCSAALATLRGLVEEAITAVAPEIAKAVLVP